MSEIPFYVVITKPNKQKIQVHITNDTGKDIENIKNKIVYLLQEEFSKLNILPESYNDFISKVWYERMSADAEPFEYKIFEDGKWVSPWSHEEIYDMVYDVLHKLELISGYINEANKDEEEFDEEDDGEIDYNLAKALSGIEE